MQWKSCRDFQFDESIFLVKRKNSIVFLVSVLKNRSKDCFVIELIDHFSRISSLQLP